MEGKLNDTLNRPYTGILLQKLTTFTHEFGILLIVTTDWSRTTRKVALGRVRDKPHRSLETLRRGSVLLREPKLRYGDGVKL